MPRGRPAGRLEGLDRLAARGVERRDFLRICTIALASVGLPVSLVPKIAGAALEKQRPSVIWLHLQECTGCTESLLRTSAPGIAQVILELVSLDYHETLMAASGHQAESALRSAMSEHAGKYVLIVEGAVPTRDDGVFCKVAGKTALYLLNEVADKAGAIIALGSCASFGGVAAAAPNPTGATGVPEILKGRQVVSLPGCPPNAYNLLGVVLQYVALGTLPALDAHGRPLFAYGRTIHDDCPRRTHFDAGRFAEKFGDEGHRNGYCLYKLGCKGPVTHANCSLLHFADVNGAWPIGIGHPCVGCTEAKVAFRTPMHQTAAIERPTPPDTYPPITTPHASEVSPVATGLGGALIGLAAGATVAAARRISHEAKEQKPAPAEGEEE